MKLEIEKLNIALLSPGSQWALQHLYLPMQERAVSEAELAEHHELTPKRVKSLLSNLWVEIRAQQAGAVVRPLTNAEREVLREQLELHGQLVPVLEDQHGNVIDGHHRKELLEELGKKVKTVKVRVDGDEDARTKGLIVNTARRQLDVKTRRQMAQDEILNDVLNDRPRRSDREIARAIGCHHMIVGRARRDLEALGLVPVAQCATPAEGAEDDEAEARPDRRAEALTAIVKELRDLAKADDRAAAHVRADELVVTALELLGAPAIARAYLAIRKE